MKIVHLLSGGLDSGVALAHWLSLSHEVRILSINYGQRHFRELESARALCEYFNLDFVEVNLEALKTLMHQNSQTGLLDVPEGHYTEDSMKMTVVPNRNMMMLSVAMSHAIDLKYDAVSFAAHGGDHTIYPDCRPEFIQAMNQVAKVCDWHPLQILAPFQDFTKSQIVKRGAELDFPFHLTWSCYKGLEKHCGKCGTCVERKEAFELSKLTDPTEYL
ncbi:MAG: 7-cyano-7-deazaguanine synthase QueC [Bdellovibrionota bacterium]